VEYSRNQDRAGPARQPPRVVFAMSTFVKILLGVAVVSAQALDINATQHILGPPYNGNENEFLAHPFVHPNGYAEAWAATLASDGLQYIITRRWNENVQSALWSARALAHMNAALQINAQMRQFNAAQAQSMSVQYQIQAPAVEHP
jgi:hypothetical protein